MSSVLSALLNPPKTAEEAARRGLLKANEVQPTPAKPKNEVPAMGQPKARCLDGSAVKEFYGAVSWAWPSWIPIGHVTLIAGPEGTGKSYLSAYLMGVFAGLLPWPDGTKYEGQWGPTLLLDTEEMRGAYVERMATLGVPDSAMLCPSPTGDPTYIPALPRDLKLVEIAAKETGAAAIIVDSLSGAHGLDENTAAMRQVLRPLVGLAGTLRLPVIVIHHARKRSELEPLKMTLSRIRGHSTITQFCRSVIMMYRLKDDLNEPVRIEAGKCSFGKPPAALGMTITDEGLLFHEPPEEDKPATAIDRAIEFLRQELDKKPQRYTELLQKAEEQGISKNSLYRARERLNVVTYNGFWGLSALQEEL